ncbi:MAG: hypothetical protein IH596_10370 [Bacteroidales bacterium]|nr:hypothetical protein [Bacteroidales bacterium]
MRKFAILSSVFLLGGILVLSSCKKKNVEYVPEEPDPRENLTDEPLPYTYTRWMASIDGEHYLNEFTIPGTHDCAADEHTSKQGAAAGNVICQDYYISNQMNLGVRWFDIRLHLDTHNGVLTAFHWHYYLHKNFNDLLTAALDFLQAYPSETIIFMIKQEYSSASDNEFASAVYDYISQRPDFTNTFWLENSMPRLCEARGKLVILSRYHNTNSIPSGLYVDWDKNTKGEFVNNCGFPLWVQDHYSCATVHYTTKIEEIKEGIQLANNPIHSQRLFINFTSFEQDLDHYIITLTKEVNPPIDDYLKAHPDYQTCGVLMLNFAGGGDGSPRTAAPDLVGTVIQMNDLGTGTVQIGSQTWMKKSLNVVTYTDDFTPIPEVEDCNQWRSLTTGAWRHFSDDVCDDGFGGRLYNWHTIYPSVFGVVCPPGFHVPTDDDWNTLVAYLGGPDVAGGKMKETLYLHWSTPNTGATDESGFSALGRGYWGNGESIGFYHTVLFYTSTPGSDSVVFRALCDTSARIIRIADTARGSYAASIRCIKDSN